MKRHPRGSEGERLLAALESRGEMPFIRSRERDLTAGAVAAQARRASERFRRAGLGPGDVVALRGLTPWEAVPCLIGAWSTGVITHPLDRREPLARLKQQVEEVHARLLVSDPPGPQIESNVLVQSPTQLFDSGGAASEAPARPPLDLPVDAATLLRTSGSSGRPKIAVHSLGQHLESAKGATTELHLEPDCGWLLSLPLHHVGGLAIVFRTLIAEAELLVREPACSLEESLVALTPTHLSLVPTQLIDLLESPAALGALSSCRRVLIGGGPLGPQFRRRAVALGLKLGVSYGSTESTAFVAASFEPEVVERRCSAGRVLPDRTVVVSPAGEIRVGGPTLFLGYLEAGRLQDARSPDGLFDTGDLGWLDGQGVLYVQGRRDRLIISGGENIQPEEIESLINEVPGVERSEVLPVPDERYGERPVAFVACRDEGLRGRDLEEYLLRHLPKFKVPDAFYRLRLEQLDEPNHAGRAELATLLRSRGDLEAF